MDIRRTGFFGYLTLNGRPVNLINVNGSIMGLVADALKTLGGERPRLADGELEIILRIRNKPFDTSMDGVMTLGKSEELAALVDDTDADKPFDNEFYEEFYHRLLDVGYPQASAEYIAGQWFDKPVNPTTTLWLNDPKAIRFRVLNSRDEEFEAALPSEYESLKHYVQTTYPDFVENLTFRTA
jgi:hypothetical protein